MPHRDRVLGSANEIKALVYDQRALRLVNERLSDPVLGVTDGILGAIVMFMGQFVGISGKDSFSWMIKLTT